MQRFPVQTFHTGFLGVRLGFLDALRVDIDTDAMGCDYLWRRQSHAPVAATEVVRYVPLFDVRQF